MTWEKGSPSAFSGDSDSIVVQILNPPSFLGFHITNAPGFMPEVKTYFSVNGYNIFRWKRKRLLPRINANFHKKKPSV
jgi:hypothetical protein